MIKSSVDIKLGKQNKENENDNDIKMNDYNILTIDNVIYDKEQIFPVFLNENNNTQCVFMCFEKDFRPKLNGIESNLNESLIDQNISPQTFIYLSANSRNYYSLTVLKTCYLLTTSIFAFIHWTITLVMIIISSEVNIDLKDKFIEYVKLLIQQNRLFLGKEICEKLLNNENISCNMSSNILENIKVEIDENRNQNGLRYILQKITNENDKSKDLSHQIWEKEKAN